MSLPSAAQCNLLSPGSKGGSQDGSQIVGWGNSRMKGNIIDIQTVSKTTRVQSDIGIFTAAVGIRLRTLRYGFFTYRNPSHESARDTNFLGATGSPDPQDGFADGKARLPAVSRGDFCHVTAGNWTKLTAVALSRAVPYYGRNFTKLPTLRTVYGTYGEKPDSDRVHVIRWMGKKTSGVNKHVIGRGARDGGSWGQVRLC
ncbi:hypothetical protein K438DRAFT_1758010 [Mycena galopus ATCC 62051]|nr:hypothetical protein K438DRAFT_1758010 [Mycena galopus ATCC 62051]